METKEKGFPIWVARGLRYFEQGAETFPIDTQQKRGSRSWTAMGCGRSFPALPLIPRDSAGILRKEFIFFHNPQAGLGWPRDHSALQGQILLSPACAIRT